MSNKSELDAVVVGAGFAGLYMLHRLRGLGLSAQVYERGAGVGGTWYWNRYPGARCDIESIMYSYSFDEDLQREWTWTERYPAQAEILEYLNHVADRFDLRRDIQLETSVDSAVYDEETATWTVTTSRGDTVTCRFLIMATGCLSDSRIPDIPGFDTFAGDSYHTARWPHEGVDFAGKRVAVIGTGSSGIQCIPVIAAEAAHTYVLQRTPQYAVPAHNAPLAPETMRDTQENYGQLREKIKESFVYIPYEPRETPTLSVPEEEFEATFQEQWDKGGLNMLLLYPDQLFSVDAADRVGKAAWDRISAKIKDPEVAERLKPPYPFAAKRLCVDTGYYETFNRDNVTLVDLRETPIEAIVPEGIRTPQGTIEVDAIVFATGFDAMTGALTRIDITGRDGLTIKEKWAEGPKNYLGLMVNGFPNLFTVTGPGSPSVISNMVPTIEQHVDWIADCLAYLNEHGVSVMEASAEAEEEWVRNNDAMANMTIFPQANSWYMGRNIEGKAEGFMPFAGGTVLYRQTCDDVAANGYRGFILSEKAGQPA